MNYHLVSQWRSPWDREWWIFMKKILKLASFVEQELRRETDIILEPTSSRLLVIFSVKFRDIWRVCLIFYRWIQFQHRWFRRSRFAAVRAKSFSRSDRGKQTTWQWWRMIYVIVENSDLQLEALRLRKKLTVWVLWLVLLTAVLCHRHAKSRT